MQELTKAQQEYFKDSQIRNEDGILLEVYHGTQIDFDAFEGGTFLTDDYYNADGYAGGEIIIAAYINLKNPLVIDCQGEKWDQLDTEYGTSTREIVDNVDRNQYDGVVFENVNDCWADDEGFEPCTVYYAFEPNQIKDVDNLYPTKSNNFKDNSQEYLREHLKDMSMDECMQLTKYIKEHNPTETKDKNVKDKER